MYASTCRWKLFGSKSEPAGSLGAGRGSSRCCQSLCGRGGAPIFPDRNPEITQNRVTIHIWALQPPGGWRNRGPAEPAVSGYFQLWSKLSAALHDAFSLQPRYSGPPAILCAAGLRRLTFRPLNSNTHQGSGHGAGGPLAVRKSREIKRETPGKSIHKSCHSCVTAVSVQATRHVLLRPLARR